MNLLSVAKFVYAYNFIAFSKKIFQILALIRQYLFLTIVETFYRHKIFVYSNETRYLKHENIYLV